MIECTFLIPSIYGAAVDNVNVKSTSPEHCQALIVTFSSLVDGDRILFEIKRKKTVTFQGKHIFMFLDVSKVTRTRRHIFELLLLDFIMPGACVAMLYFMLQGLELFWKEREGSIFWILMRMIKRKF